MPYVGELILNEGNKLFIGDGKGGMIDASNAQAMATLIKERDEARAEVERLKAEFGENRKNSRIHLDELLEANWQLAKDRDTAKEEASRLRYQLNSIQRVISDAGFSEVIEPLERVTRLIRERDQAIAERTPHDYGILREERDQLRAESARLQALDAARADEVDAVNARLIETRKERDEAREEAKGLRVAFKFLEEKHAFAIKETERFAGFNNRYCQERDEAKEQIEKLYARISNIQDTAHGWCRQRDEARAEVESLKQSLQKSSDNNMDLIQRLAETFIELDKARDKIAKLKADSEAPTVKQSLTVRPEPSRLEIAKDIYASLIICPENITMDDALARTFRITDKLISLAKESPLA